MGIIKRRGSFTLAEGRFDKTQHKSAFTLAEVLITLTIIGVVAALTIPSLVVKNQEKETVVRLKKAYNILNNAFSLAVIDYGDPTGWGSVTYQNGNYNEDKVNNVNSEGGAKIARILNNYLNVMRDCKDQEGCLAKSYSNYSRTQTSPPSIKAGNSLILADGSALAFRGGNENCLGHVGGKFMICGAIDVDINGAKGPNVSGIDLFAFFITKDAIIPRGLKGMESEWNSLTSCRSNGNTCTAWVLINENMDYPPLGKDWD